jgi:ubiquinone/menaquinone biosynthesis C-methylase UbiE
MTKNLAFTGERYIPDVKGEIRLEHIHRYALAQGLVKGKNVLDIACGEGYGSRMLAEYADVVVGIDISQEAVDHAVQKYSSKKNLTFKTGSASQIDFPNQSFDLVVSFETIEHLIEQSEMIAEIRRVLKPDGALLISSPNRPIYSEESNQHNEYHVKELDFREFDKLLREKFESIKYFGQRLIISSLVQYFESGETEFQAFYDDGDAVQKKLGPIQDSKYYIAYCTADAPDKAPFGSSILQTNGFDLLKQYISYARWASNTDAEIQQLRHMYSKLQGDHHNIATWAQSLDRQLTEQKVKHIEEEQKNLVLTNQINSLVLSNSELKHKIKFLQSDVDSLTKDKAVLEVNLAHIKTELEAANAKIHQTQMSLNDEKQYRETQVQQHKNENLQLQVEHQSEINFLLTTHNKKVVDLECSVDNYRNLHLQSIDEYKNNTVELCRNSEEKLTNLAKATAEERSILFNEIQKLQYELQKSSLQRENEAKLSQQMVIDLQKKYFNEEKQLQEQLLSCLNRIEENYRDLARDFNLKSKKSFDQVVDFQNEFKSHLGIVKESQNLLHDEISRSENIIRMLSEIRSKRWWHLK